jgi:hypothetical protein
MSSPLTCFPVAKNAVNPCKVRLMIEHSIYFEIIFNVKAK